MLDLNFAKQPFSEQLKFFRQKQIATPEEIAAISGNIHDYAFVVSGLTRADLLEDVKWLVDQAIEKGETPEQFERKFNRLVGRKGWRPDGKPGSEKYSRRLYTILDTNQRQSHRAGRYAQYKRLPKDSPLKFRYWVHRDSPNFRESHKALHLKALEASNPFWDKCLPACAWGCRCDSFLATEAVLKQRGIPILRKAPDPKTIADPEFIGIPKIRDFTEYVLGKKKELPSGLKPTVKESDG